MKRQYNDSEEVRSGHTKQETRDGEEVKEPWAKEMVKRMKGNRHTNVKRGESKEIRAKKRELDRR